MTNCEMADLELARGETQVPGTPECHSTRCPLLMRVCTVDGREVAMADAHREVGQQILCHSGVRWSKM